MNKLFYKMVISNVALTMSACAFYFAFIVDLTAAWVISVPTACFLLYRAYKF